MRWAAKPNSVAGGATSPHEVAAEWLLRDEARGLSDVERQRLDRWLEASPANRAAWADVHLTMNTVSENAADPQLMAMRSAALTARGEPGRRLPGLAVAAAVVALVVAGSWGAMQFHDGNRLGEVASLVLRQSWPDAGVYRTNVGERATIALPDGSLATLDTDSALKVEYTAAERGVRLLSGQALFEVAKHRTLPFQVYAGNSRITAVGTKFDVRLYGSGEHPQVRVALIEGVVRVTKVDPAPDASAPREVVTMTPGELLTASPEEPVRVVRADTERMASWRAGFLTFDDVPLAQAVAEMNRYTSDRIVVRDESISPLHVSGVFKTGDADHFAATLADGLPLRVARSADGDIELLAKN